ncbi:MAG TPA: adenylate/guanylate cyclase domain-containing protein [Polyangiaceae bacterium]|nr:adenylate/guanylate cyclase domain-containing protein [Polyangiaceae bacterium]
MAKLLRSTAEGQQAIELRAVNSLGRHPNNTIQLLDKIVSKEHCIVEVRDGRFVLRDLGSLNGTYVNGERVRGETWLKHGDEIALGSTRARFDDGSGVALPLPPVGPGAIQNAIASWPASNVTAPHSPQAMAGQQQAPPPPPMRQQAYSQPMVPTAVPVPPQMAPMHAPAPSRGAPPPAPLPPPGAAPRPPSLGGTRVDVLDAARAIGTQIAAQTKGFLPFDAIANDSKQLRLDYERLRITWELTRDIGLERELDVLLDKILLALFKFTKADRGVILLRENDGTLHPRAARRRDGTTAAIQVSSTILNHVITERMGVLTHDASMDFAASKGKSMILNRISSAMVVPLIHENEKEVLGVVWLDSESLAQFQPKDLELITSVAGQAAMFIENTILAKKVEQEILVRDRFQRLVAPNVAEQMISGKLEVKKGGQLIQELTIYNSDIRGFTAMSEGTSAETLVEMLNEYFELMVETLFKYEGTLDKFMGDGIMAFWGAPLVHRDDAVRCVQCALDQMEVLGRFNRERIAAGKPALAVGLGIHTGPGVVGYVGSSKALSYTTIGDTANTSARLCSSAASGQIVISEATLAKLGGRFEFEEIEPRSLKGKEKPMRRFNILREKPTAAVARAGGLG